MDNIEYRPIKRKSKGKLAPSRLQCGPGQNCKAQSVAATKAIQAILAGAAKPGCSSTTQAAYQQSVQPTYLDR